MCAASAVTKQARGFVRGQVFVTFDEELRDLDERNICRGLLWKYVFLRIAVRAVDVMFQYVGHGSEPWRELERVLRGSQNLG